MSGDGERSPLLPAELGEPGTPGAGGTLAGPGGLVPSAPLPPYGGPAAGKPAPPHGFPPFPDGHPAVLPGEDPPPYSPMASPDSGSAPMITCRVCQSLINVEGKMHQHVVKCSVCNEATVTIKNAPQGKKYCEDVPRIACPRPYWAAPRAQKAGLPTCVSLWFSFSQWTEFTDRTLARCPHCRKVSSIGRRYPWKRCICCLLLGVLVAVAATGLAFGTWRHARRYSGIYASWALIILLAVLCLGRAMYWACMRVSHPVQNFS
uniref:Phosphatidylinositol-4,5-bisphosphate 4-phosphatase n=1 Tax=Gopherus evgoodei TaxID=1825980 RepID=A0A8C4WT77_9SAUR